VICMLRVWLLPLCERLNVELFGMGGHRCGLRAWRLLRIIRNGGSGNYGDCEALPSLLRAMERLVEAADKRRPALAILTDFPGFHLRLARKLKPKGIRNVYYICPQFWAWRPWRANLVRRRFAKALCIFPFEEKVFSALACRRNYRASARGSGAGYEGSSAFVRSWG